MHGPLCILKKYLWCTLRNGNSRGLRLIFNLVKDRFSNFATQWDIPQLLYTTLECTYHSSVGIFGPIRKCWCKCGWTAFIIVCIFSCVDGRVDGNGPHGGCIAITVAIIVFTSITRCPDIDVAQTITALIKFPLVPIIQNCTEIYWVLHCICSFYLFWYCCR